LNSLDSHVAVLLAFFLSRGNRKNRTEKDQGSTGDAEAQ
jgi:hypothetical protein